MNDKERRSSGHRIFMGSIRNGGDFDEYITTVAEEEIIIDGVRYIKVFDTEKVPNLAFAGFGCSFQGCEFMIPDTGREVHFLFGQHNVICHSGEREDTRDVRMVSLFVVD